MTILWILLVLLLDSVTYPCVINFFHVGIFMKFMNVLRHNSTQHGFYASKQKDRSADKYTVFTLQVERIIKINIKISL